MKLLIAGSGTAGLITALILKTYLNIQIDIVHSKKIDIIGVGEGSTEHFREFMNFVGINQYDLIKSCDATYKSGIMFENWGNRPYLHSVISPFESKIAQYSYVYANQISNNYPITTKFIWENKIESNFLNNPTKFPYNQFHFNTHKLNDFLTNLCISKGITFYNDEITDVILNCNGEIDSIKSELQTYNYDFYIDSTGFKKLLINKLGGKWKSYSPYLKMNSAITFQTPDEENYNLWTLSKAMDAGWLFKIPVWGRHGNGYIFDSNYIGVDDAKKEVEELLGHPIDIGKQFKFDPGHLEQAWIKNCCAVGLSASFVEPLEASSIGTTIQQSFILMQKLINYHENVITQYNNTFGKIMDNIRDFIALHYITQKENTKFWKDLKNIELPDTLKNNLELWKRKLPINEDFSNFSNYCLFTSNNYIVVMEGLDLFDRESIKMEYNNQHPRVKTKVHNIISTQEAMYQDCNTTAISHKEFLSLIRKHC